VIALIPLEFPFRLATPEDAVALADLVNFAGEGLPYHVWCQMADQGQDPWEIGRRRQAAKAEEGQIVVVDTGEGAVAGLTGYAIGAKPEPIGEDMPPLFGPLQELENLALRSWYVNVLACYPRHRGKGHGTKLLELAEEIARDADLEMMSVIVASNNAGARRLYERLGYGEVARRPCVRNGWDTETDEWVLLTKMWPGVSA
jgi:ribosomal protein S18 acetylase RimI-like enzyme